jgi:hypothetical protein
MQYLLLIYGNEAAEAKLSEAERSAELGEYMTFTKMVRERGVYISGEALHPTTAATTVRVRDGKTLTTDGPFAETHEQLGGFYLLDCKDMDEAIECASKIPGARHGSIEIRPIVVFS